MVINYLSWRCASKRLLTHLQSMVGDDAETDNCQGSCCYPYTSKQSSREVSRGLQPIRSNQPPRIFTSERETAPPNWKCCDLASPTPPNEERKMQRPPKTIYKEMGKLY
ncbi:uncharacterized protein LOC124159153 isoform X2 [Ischnura elegans]|uniref:uncharacterized protein LOC124159153 isoform X2 n=1 Tax=Ischnura elegans TaxID=197161 RepID=UPI001ED8A27C|nr:uncharacterized protein LOC124159153 isoform X2 [Ischnura elegans]XP_046390721.1 uncharacterized protein LOC124159153 isoform X2 [Ischnura elegans]